MGRADGCSIVVALEDCCYYVVATHLPVSVLHWGAADFGCEGILDGIAWFDLWHVFNGSRLVHGGDSRFLSQGSLHWTPGIPSMKCRISVSSVADRFRIVEKGRGLPKGSAFFLRIS